MSIPLDAARQLTRGVAASYVVSDVLLTTNTVATCSLVLAPCLRVAAVGPYGPSILVVELLVEEWVGLPLPLGLFFGHAEPS